MSQWPANVRGRLFYSSLTECNLPAPLLSMALIQCWEAVEISFFSPSRRQYGAGRT